MQKLQVLIESLCRGRKIHISVLDLKGILTTQLTALDSKYCIHSKEMCNLAKSTERGFRLCLFCKARANGLASYGGESFCGHCPFGIFEAATPVKIGDTVCAVVYVGHALYDKDYSLSLMRRAAKFAEANSQVFEKNLCRLEPIDDPDELCRIGEIVADYIRLLHSQEPRHREDVREHWLVVQMKNRAKNPYYVNITLQNLAKIYGKNEKYLGRLFKQITGISYAKYVMDERLSRAEAMLCDRGEKILDIALECGFNSISYFNRAFKDKYGTPPSEYRKRKK